MTVAYTSSRCYHELAKNLPDCQKKVLNCLEANPKGLTIRELSRILAWFPGTVSARLNELEFPKKADEVLAEQLTIKRYCTVSGKLAIVHRALSSDKQGRINF